MPATINTHYAVVRLLITSARLEAHAHLSIDGVLRWRVHTFLLVSTFLSLGGLCHRCTSVQDRLLLSSDVQKDSFDRSCTGMSAFPERVDGDAGGRAEKPEYTD